MSAVICLCRSVLRGTEKPYPGMIAPHGSGNPGPESVSKLATATIVAAATAATAAEAGQKQDPDQPFTAIIVSATAVVVTEQSAAVVVTAATAAEQ